MTTKERHRAIQQLTPDQIRNICDQVTEYLALNRDMDCFRPAVCPKCGASEGGFIKKGFANRRQRFQCRSCGRKFTADAALITSYSHQPTSSWVRVLEDMLNLVPVRETEQIIGVSHPTALFMRQKLAVYLDPLITDAAMENAMNGSSTPSSPLSGHASSAKQARRRQRSSRGGRTFIQEQP